MNWPDADGRRHHFDLARLICSIPFCPSILSYTLGFILTRRDFFSISRMKGFC